MLPDAPDLSSLLLQHLDWSPLEYIRWRYEIGEDREGLDKVDRAVRVLRLCDLASKSSLGVIARQLTVSDIASQQHWRETARFHHLFKFLPLVMSSALYTSWLRHGPEHIVNRAVAVWAHPGMS